MDDFPKRYAAARRRREVPLTPCQDAGKARCCPACREVDLRVLDVVRAASGGQAVVRRRCCSCGQTISRLEDIDQ